MLSTLCLVASLKVSVLTKIAHIKCTNGESLTQQVVTGNPTAKNKLDRTPIGTFKVSEVTDGLQDYMKGAAKFHSYHTTPNAQGETEVGYYIHGFLPSSYGQGSPSHQLKGNSIGCIRMDMRGIRFAIGSTITITN
jgi:L,D-transpeptidase catalytic domain